MTSFSVDLIFKSKGQRELDKLARGTGKLDLAAKKAQGSLIGASNGVRKFDRSARTAAAGAQSLNAAFAKVAIVIGAVTSAVGIFNQSVARTESERKILILAGAYGEAAQLADIAARASDKFGNSQTETNNALATTYARLRPVGVGLADIESIYGGFNTAARLAGANAQESAGAFRQLAQALGSGALRGDEFNSIAEQAPLVLQAVAKETGLAVGELRDFAATGGITADIVIKALKRIETEGAGQLAESLKGPQQAIKNFQNAFQDLSAEFGKLSEPALIAFFNGLTAVTKAVTDNMERLGKVAQTLIDVIYKPFAALAAGIAETGPKMEGFGQTVMEVIGMSIKIFGDFANFMAPVFNVIGKVLGQAITWFWEFAKGVASAISGAAKAVVAGVRLMANAISTLINTTPVGALSKLFGFDIGEFAAGPLNALAGGLESVGSAVTGYVGDVVQAGKDFAVSAAKVTAPIDRNYDPSTLATKDTSGAGSGGKGGGGKGAASGAAKALEEQNKQLQAARDLLFTAQETNKVLQGRTEFQTANLEANQKINEIEREYSQLKSEALSNEETAILEKAKGVELTNTQLGLDKQIADLKESAVGSIQDEIELLNAKLNGTEKELKMRREIANITANGSVGAGEARTMLETRNALEKQFETQEKAKASAEGLASSIAGGLTDSLRGLVDGSMSAEEALSNAFSSIADAFLEMAMQMIQEWIKMQLLGIIGNAFGGASPLGSLGGGSLGANGGSMFGNTFSGFSGMSFAGGGYTGNGPRSGGVDGHGGALALIHPQETVVDHARGNAGMGEAMSRYSMSNGGGGSGGGPDSFHLDTTVINNIEYATVEQVKEMGRKSTKDGAAAGKAQTLSAMRNSRGQRSRLGI